MSDKTITYKYSNSVAKAIEAFVKHRKNPNETNLAKLVKSDQKLEAERNKLIEMISQQIQAR